MGDISPDSEPTDDSSMTTSQALDHTLQAYGRLERKHADLKREVERLREALRDIERSRLMPAGETWEEAYREVVRIAREAVRDE